MRELPATCRTSQAVRLWPARESDPRVCEWFNRMFADDEVMVSRHPPATSAPERALWWIAGPIEKPMRPHEAHPPDIGELVCDWCLPQAVYTYNQSWQEANL